MTKVKQVDFAFLKIARYGLSSCSYKASFSFIEKQSTCLRIAYLSKQTLLFTVKPVLSGQSKIDKTMVFKTNGSLMKVESIAEWFLRAFCNTFDLHSAIICLEINFWSAF